MLEGRWLPSTVINLLDTGAGSLRQAILDTPAGGTVDFQPGLTGTIMLRTDELRLNKDVTIAGPGANVITVSGGPQNRVFEIIGATVTATLSGLTISNGFEVSGGGIRNGLGTLFLSDCVVSNNNVEIPRIPPLMGAARGGGIANFGGTVTLTNCTVSDNHTGFGYENSGGGIYTDGTLTLVNSTVTLNGAGAVDRSQGGGIECAGGSLTIIDSAINANGQRATFSGGAISAAANTTITITNSNINNNDALDSGGGIETQGTLNITDSTISGNAASHTNGGGIFAYAGATLTITGSTIAGNTAVDSGGGIFVADSGATVAVTNSTLSGDRASKGGGIFGNPGATLTITDSTLTGNGADFGGAIYNKGTLTITGSNLPGNSAADSGGGIYVTDSGATVAVTNSTLSGGGASKGGGIFANPGATLTITDSSLTDNNANFGGAIYNKGTLTITGSNLAGNFAQNGGGIRNESQAILIIDNSTLSGNSADEGGAIDTIANASLNVNGSTFTLNTARLGGAIITTFGTVDVVNTTFSDNSARNGSGGAIYAESDSTLTIAGSTFSGNTTRGSGGAIHQDLGTLFIVNSTFSTNSALIGGAIHLYLVTGNISSSTISRNTAQGDFFSGGGIMLDPSPNLFLRNTIIAGNSDSGSPDVSGSLISQGHNLIGDGTGGSGFDPTDLVGTSSNPIDPKLGPLQDNGGPTQTMALLPGSPAIDAGDNTNATEFDQRGPGFPRIVNGIIDIGAFEVQAVALTVHCSVTVPVLWPPNHQLVNVGLSVQVSDPNATVTVQVYANDDALPSDAADLAPGRLRLRSQRQGSGSGRVYLIVVTATDAAGNVAVSECTVVAPHDHSAHSQAAVEQQAADAEAYFQAFHTAPPRYRLLG
jgi:predicted outer membrane repeat protein